MRRGLLPSRTAAREAVAAGRVLVRGIPADRPATLVDEAADLALTVGGPRWASRAGAKLAAALGAFAVDPAGRRCLDVGASTGGFTDVLLGAGAASVAAVDVGYGQLDWRLRSDPRVMVFDRTNFRFADPAALGAPFGLVVADVSFISLRLLAPALAACGTSGTEYVVLVKPQFEVGRGEVGRRGLVTDPRLHRSALSGVATALAESGVGPSDACPSQIAGATGNREFFLHARWGVPVTLDEAAVARAVEL